MPAAAQAVGPRYPTSASSPAGAGDCSGTAGTSLSSNRVPCEPSSPLVTATPTSTGADYPRYSHRKPPQAAASTTTHGASRHSAGPCPCRDRLPGPSRSGSPAEVLGRDRVEELPELLDLV